jgi:hypothetical protein
MFNRSFVVIPLNLLSFRSKAEESAFPLCSVSTSRELVRMPLRRDVEHRKKTRRTGVFII